MPRFNFARAILVAIASAFVLSGCATADIFVKVTPDAKKTSPIIQWTAPAAITYGTTLSSAQLNATASVAGQFTYSPALGTTPNVGTNQLTAKFTPTDTTHYATVTATVALTVSKATPTITWPTPAPITAGAALSSSQLDATASVPGNFTYTPALGDIPSAGVVTLKATFTPTSTTHYNTATASVTLTINPAITSQSTIINVGSSVIQTGMKRLGMNIDGQNFYDSGQMMRNLIFRNPGFEGETWQSILQCVQVTATTCTDSNPWTQWPANFLTGATFEFIYGSANGETGTVASSTAASTSANAGITIQFPALAKPPAAGDFVVVRMNIPGNAQAGWWTSTSGGSTISTELSDLSTETPGKQALRVTAAGAGQVATVDSYFDSTGTHNYVLMNGTYKISFKAKGVGGNNQLNLSVGRQITNGTYLNQTITLTPTWQNYTFTFTAAETPTTATGTIDFHFGITGSSVLIDDVSLRPLFTSAANLTAFRDEVVNTLTALHPGTLRYMDGLPTFGSSIDNMIASQYARQRAGSSEETTEQDDLPIGLYEFLQLCQTVGAEPWFTMPPAMTPTEMQNLIQYFAGDATTTYGAKRAAMGQTAPWTTVFPVIHLELGNEQWNEGTFPGNVINDPVAYGKRVSTIFAAARSAPLYNASNFDLIMGSFVENPWYTSQEIANSANYDSVSVAPYLFGTFSDTSSNEAIFAPMFAEPEMWDSTPIGWMAQQSVAVTAAGKKLVSYEENLGTQSGTASQDMINATIPSIAGGVTMADHMLLQMRDLGVQTQNVWALPGFNNQFNNTNGGSETSPIFGTVIDMGGQTNRQRPVFLAEQLVNTAILPQMLGTSITGPDPTWSQLLSLNDSVVLPVAHELQTFAFTDGANGRSLVVINLARSAALPVTFSGANAPTGSVTVGTLTSANLTDSNESSDLVIPTSQTLTSFDPTAPYSLPPFSITVFTWQAN